MIVWRLVHIDIDMRMRWDGMGWMSLPLQSTGKRNVRFTSPAIIHMRIVNNEEEREGRIG